jgi:hypothetical protein
MSKEFKFFGTTVTNGKTKVRAAVEIKSRLATLAKHGHTNIVFVELPAPVSKLHGLKHIVTLPEFASVEQQEALNAYIEKHDDGLEVVFSEAPAASLTAEEADALEAALAPVDESSFEDINTYVDAEVAALKAEMKMTFDEAMSMVPMRDKGRFIKKEVREQMARDLMASV